MVMVLVAVLTLVSVAFYLAEWVPAHELRGNAAPNRHLAAFPSPAWRCRVTCYK